MKRRDLDEHNDVVQLLTSQPKRAVLIGYRHPSYLEDTGSNEGEDPRRQEHVTGLAEGARPGPLKGFADDAPVSSPLIADQRGEYLIEVRDRTRDDSARVE